MSNSKAIGQFFGAFDPVNWHAHVIGGMDSINKPRGNFIQTLFVQKPVQFGLSVLSIGSGALAIVREILCALGKLLVVPLTLAVGTVRVVTWSRFAQPLYHHLPGFYSLAGTAHRVMLQFTGIICSALGGAFFLFQGTRFTVRCQLDLGNYERYVPEKKKAKPLEYPAPAVIEPPKAAEAAPHIPQPATYVPSLVVDLPPQMPPPAPVPAIPDFIPAATAGVVPAVPPPVTAVNPKEWWHGLDHVLRNRIANWTCKMEQIAVPDTPGLQNRLDVLNQASKPAIEQTRIIKFRETHQYQVEACPKNRQEIVQFLQNLAQSRNSLVVTLSNEGEHWWKLLREPLPLPENMSIEWEKDEAGHHPAEVLPVGTESGYERIIKRIFVVKQGGNVMHRITQYHYDGWRADPARLNLLVDEIDKVRGSETPIVIQCSDGKGASGVFIACHWLKYKVEDKKLNDPATMPRVKIEKLILQMRSMQTGMVHETAHLQAIYKTLAKRFTPYKAVAFVKAVTPRSVKTITNVALKGLGWVPNRLIKWWYGSKPAPPIPPPITLHP